MRPTRRTILIVIAAAVVAVLPAATAPSLWPLWPGLISVLIIALGADLMLSVSRSRVACTLEAAEFLYIGETGEAVLTLDIPGARSIPFRAAVDLSELLVPQAYVHGRCGTAGT